LIYLVEILHFVEPELL